MLQFFEYIFYMILAISRTLVTAVVLVVHKISGNFIFSRAQGEWQEWNEINLKMVSDKILPVAFEISSEGELEQALPLMRFLKNLGYQIEILYASFSVKTKAIKVALELEAQVLVLPLILYSRWPKICGYNISKTLQAKTLVLCRYDFYPELLFWKLFDFSKSLVLISASLKNKEIGPNSPIKTILWRYIYNHFDLIVCASPAEAENFLSLGINPQKLEVFDFRIAQICQRQKNAQQTMVDKGLKNYFAKLSNLVKSQKLILGNAYKEDIEILKNPKIQELIRNKEIHIFIAPHSLLAENIAAIFGELKKCFTEESIFLMNKDISKDDSPLGKIYICKLPGVLCEIYTLFSCAYVSGGFHRSVHSILEPYLAANAIVVGPKIHRSTEYDLAQNNSPHFVLSVKQLNQVADLLLEKLLLFKNIKTWEEYRDKIEIWSGKYQDQQVRDICQKIFNSEKDSPIIC